MQVPATPHEAQVFCALSRDLRCIVDASGHFVRWSECWASSLGYPEQGLRDAAFLDLIDEADRAAVAAALEVSRSGAPAGETVARVTAGNGTPVWVEWRLCTDEDGLTFVVGLDVTERRRSAETVASLRLLEDEAEQIAHLGSWRLNLTDGSLVGSPELYRVLHADPSVDLLAQTALARQRIHPDDAERFEAARELILSGAPAAPVDFRVFMPDDDIRWLHAQGRLIRDADGDAVAVGGFIQDITDRARADEALRASEERYRSAIDGMQDAFFQADADGVLTLVNSAAVRMYGFDSPADMVGRAAASLYADAQERDDVLAQLRRDGTVFDRIGLGLRQDGTTLWVSLNVSVVRNDAGDVLGTEGFARDVTERVRASEALHESEEDLRDAQAIARIGSYVFDMVADRWTSSATMDDIFGIDAGYVRDYDGWAALVHEDDRQMMVDYFNDDVAGKRQPFDKQYRVTRPVDGETVWVHGHGRLEFDADGHPTRLVGAIQDISRRHLGEEALRTTNESLERMVYDVAEAMGRVIEIRDQYTKGHQERTARVAKAIALEMGMPPHDVAAVEMAAVVHDIGKLSVPAEILTRPTLLTELEMSLIREHPRNGYEILKDIPFPWPVAQIVLQHHERMDGSGYPEGLTGERIAPLARVLCVADVVEAMATHRPYRPALGIDAAVAELRAAPAKYDPAVVEACLRLYERGELLV